MSDLTKKERTMIGDSLLTQAAEVSRHKKDAEALVSRYQGDPLESYHRSEAKRYEDYARRLMDLRERVLLGEAS